MQVQPERLRESVKNMVGREVGGAKCISSEIVTGPYDIICVCEGPDLNAISNCVLDCCGIAPGAQRTLTCLVVE